MTMTNRNLACSMARVAAPVALGLGLAGCGLEALVAEAFDETHVLPTTVVAGTVDPSLPMPVFEVLQPDGASVDILESQVSGGVFTLTLPSAEYQNTRLVATQGEKQVRTLVPRMPENASVDGVTLGPVTSARMLALEAKMSADSRTLSTLSPETISGVFAVMDAAFDDDGSDGQKVRDYVAAILEAADVTGTTVPFQAPALDNTYTTTTSALVQSWLDDKMVDYDGDGAVNTGTTATAAFDAALAAFAQALDFDECLNPERIRVVFEVDFNEGRKDGNCNNINRFRWVQDDPGKTMYIVGGIHEDSPVQDPELDAAMSNTGGWVPNQIPMFDDGTNGDAVAGDNIWTIYFDMPRGARVGYKYTWGTQGQLWTGTEEWPGNQRILEAVDVNGDDIVLRRDNFQDEATNKDKSNLNIQGMGEIDWEADVNGDGVPDARERQLDLDNDCVLDEWITPAGVGPATVDCADIADQ